MKAPLMLPSHSSGWVTIWTLHLRRKFAFCLLWYLPGLSWYLIQLVFLFAMSKAEIAAQKNVQGSHWGSEYTVPKFVSLNILHWRLPSCGRGDLHAVYGDFWYALELEECFRVLQSTDPMVYYRGKRENLKAGCLDSILSNTVNVTCRNHF